MKNTFCFFATTMILFLGFQYSTNAQKSATWKGGTPGNGTDWNCASNWKEGRVPNEFSDVCIPDVSTASGIQPVVRISVAGVNSLTILSGGRLRIEKTGALDVYGWVEIFDAGSIQNNGTFRLPQSNGSLAEKRSSKLSASTY